MVITYLRSERDKSGVDKCSGVDWVLLFILIGVAVVSGVIGIIMIVRD